MVYPVVIPLKDEPTRFGDAELDYCLRSIAKHYPTEVFIVTDTMRPFKAQYIKHKDSGINRYDCVRRKIIAAADVLKEPFLLWNDDIYLTEPFQAPPHYYDGMIEDRMSGNDGYSMMLQKTGRHGDGRNYELHYPMLIDPYLFKQVTVPGLLYRSIYASASDHPKAPKKDVKIRTRKEHSRFNPLPVFSISDYSLVFIREEMERLFPRV